MDAAGKDGTIRHVMSGVNPQGVEVHSFKIPSAEELDHDYLWRYRAGLPARGQIGIFNRSHYEEVLVVRVHPEILAGQKLPPSSKRATSGSGASARSTTGSATSSTRATASSSSSSTSRKEEQRRRFLERIDEPEKNWKFSADDAKERRYWDDYQQAFSEVLSNTSTEWAPWYVIPADDKPFARVVAAGVIADALIDIDPRTPPSATRPGPRSRASRPSSWPRPPQAPRPTRSPPSLPPRPTRSRRPAGRASAPRRARRAASHSAETCRTRQGRT